MGHMGWRISLAFSPDGQTIVSGSDSEDETAKLWSIDGDLLHTFNEATFATFSPDGKTIASGAGYKKTNKIVVSRWNFTSYFRGE